MAVYSEPRKVPSVKSARGIPLDAGAVVFIVALVALAFMVVLPLGWLLFTSVQTGDTGRFTLGNYVEAFTKSIYLAPIVNSLILASGVATIAVLIGAPLAWLVARTDVPARGLLRTLVVAAFVTPSFLGAQAWILLAAPNSGWFNKAFVALTHAEHGPLNIYSLAGAIFVMAMYNVPYTFTFVSGALAAMPAELEDAAAILGANGWRRTFSIALPLAMPAIVAGFIMSFLEALAEFGTPAFLLIPARAQVITTQLYLFFQFPSRVELAAAYAMPLLFVTAGLLYVQRRMIGRRRYTMIGAKGTRRHPISLGRWRWPAFALALGAPLCSVILPYLALLLASLSRQWGIGPVPGNLTAYWYHWAFFDNPQTQAAIAHSFEYGFAAATIALLVATAIGVAVTRKLVPGGSWLAFICMAPFVVPGIVLAIGFFSAYSRPPLVLYGTAWILIIAYATRFLPIAFSNITTALGTLSADLENAARTLGASRLHSLFTITMPLLRPAMLSAWLLVFIPALRELSCAIFLFTPRTAVMATVIFDFSDAGNFEAVATLGIIIMVATLAIVSAMYRFLGRSPVE
ncbi:MAG: iron ABC transporter permease [Candidatus Eremiobacteraeota bacterium]|nr:iron ABC transporter permease [Candidatus Eremiobacteraeota bacterium]